MKRAAVGWMFLVLGCAAKEAPPLPEKAPPKPAVLSFKNDIAPSLDLHCALPHCHGEIQTQAVEMDLRIGHSYEALVNHAADARTGSKRVVPGDVAHSLIIDKLTGALAADEGKAMPIDASTGRPMVPNPLAAWTEQKLLPWIAAGAPNN